MTEEHWVSGTPDQLARMNALASRWLSEGQEDEAIVLLGAATGLLLNAIQRGVPAQRQEAVIEGVYRSLRQMLE